MKRVAIPLEQERLCAHFGHCEQFAVFDVDNGLILAEERLIPPPHEPGLLPGWLAEQGVTHVLAGGMGQRALDLFAARSIEVTVGVQPKHPAALVQEWLNKTLKGGSNACDH
ncbi:MAG: ATPase [Bacteroidales bacterium]|jgi:predicted Fe-Mo cluster-binding NifX family protein|nr:ATPase [Bacteroidales bacterium]OPZ99716.1 MAG: Dinitrogenase iron-molybdenum cofactor [Bacteroidetes bacterium ADurb.Bin416]